MRKVVHKCFSSGYECFRVRLSASKCFRVCTSVCSSVFEYVVGFGAYRCFRVRISVFECVHVCLSVFECVQVVFECFRVRTSVFE